MMKKKEETGKCLSEMDGELPARLPFYSDRHVAYYPKRASVSEASMPWLGRYLTAPESGLDMKYPVMDTKYPVPRNRAAGGGLRGKFSPLTRCVCTTNAYLAISSRCGFEDRKKVFQGKVDKTNPLAYPQNIHRISRKYQVKILKISTDIREISSGAQKISTDIRRISSGV